MANPTANISEYLSILSRSRLLPAAEVTGVYERWQGDAGPVPFDSQVEAFRKYLVANRYLTEYQAVMVQRGHADGFQVGGYVIQERVGKGQTAGVYRAIHLSGQTVALKVLSGSKAKNPQVLGRFQREGRLLTQLNHANIVRAYQIGMAGGLHYIAMECLEGETLDEVIARRQKLPPPEAVRLVEQAFRGLQHLHDRRMVHRDLKPANLIVVPHPGNPLSPASTLDETLKILDIGLGRELFDDDDSGTQDLHLTAEGSLVGTPDYLAPEQARDARGADIRSDIYSLGCVLYYLLAGRPPFSEKNVMATMVKHATEAVPAVTQYNPAVTPGLLGVMNRLLAKDPTGRYATPTDAAEALRPYLPTNSAAADESTLLPAYSQYLRSEAVMDLPGEAPAPPPPVPAKPKPPARSGPIQVSGLGGARTAPPPGVGGSAPSPALKPPSMPSRPGLRPSSRTDLALSDFDVELVTLPPMIQSAQSDYEPLEPRIVAAMPYRPLYELDRRDFVMLGVGSGGVIAAIAAGFVAALTMKKKATGEEEEQRENQP